MIAMLNVCQFERTMCCCKCTSNTARARGFAITYFVILGIAGFLQILQFIFGTVGFLQILFSTYWCILSILVVIGTCAKHHILLLVSTVLGWLGIFGFGGFGVHLFLYYGLWHIQEETLGFGIWLFVIWLLISFFYVLSIHGAMQEVRETVPTIPVQNQQVYPTTPGPLGVELGQHIDMQPKYDVEPSAPPSYYELFPTMEQSSK